MDFRTSVTPVKVNVFRNDFARHGAIGQEGDIAMSTETVLSSVVLPIYIADYANRQNGYAILLIPGGISST